MAGSTFGTLFRITTWGESHGKGTGCVVDGCPAGLALCEEDIQKYLGHSTITTTEGIYAHFDDSQNKVSVDSLSD